MRLPQALCKMATRQDAYIVPIGFAPCHSLLAAPIFSLLIARPFALPPMAFAVEVFRVRPFAEILRRSRRDPTGLPLRARFWAKSVG
jgi:hypothetical protein